MKVVQYEGRAAIRKISKSDFASVGVEDQGAINVDRRDRLRKGQLIVSDDAAEYLTEHESFRLIEDEKDMVLPVRTEFKKTSEAPEPETATTPSPRPRPKD